MTTSTTSRPARTTPALRIARRLVPAQTLLVLGSSVDLTLTGIVGSRLAPSPELATVPFSLIPIVAASSTFALSRWIGRVGYRRVFTAAPCFAVVAGLVSALAVQLALFWLFCIGTALIGVYSAGAGYYRYAAAEASPTERARAVSTVLAGGLIAALIGPFLATAVSGLTATPFVASYLLVAVAGAFAVGWNARLPSELAAMPGAQGPSTTARPEAAPRSRSALWRQPTLLLGVAAAVLASITMTSMMTAGPIAGMAMGHSESEAALAVQLHMVGMFAPGFIVARWIGRFGERRIALLGAAMILVAGSAAASSIQTWAFLAAMMAVGVGWNLAYSGGSAMIAASYTATERGRVQPVAELAITATKVIGSLSAGILATVPGWHVLGVAIMAVALATGVALLVRRSAGDSSASGPVAAQKN